MRHAPTPRLLPATKGDALFSWRNTVSLRLASFISINYRLNVTRNPNFDIEDKVRTEHDVQLRFSYMLF